MDAIAIAREVADAIVRGDFETATARFDNRMRAGLSAERLADGWKMTQEQAGAFEGFGEPTTDSAGGAVVVQIPATFERGDLMLTVAVAGERIGGLAIAPAPPEIEHPMPRYADGGAIVDEAVTVDAGGWPLPGTLTLPRARRGLRRKIAPPYPCVVLVHGSGPNDRDETVGGSKVFFDLALGLASRGVATLRYEKRTREHRARAAEVADTITVEDEVIDDALAAVAVARAHPQIDRVFVLGHSLGGRLAPSIGLRDTSIAGLIVVAGNARPLEDVIVEQHRYLASLLTDETQRAHADERIAELEQQAERARTLTAKSRVKAEDLPLGQAKAYWLSLRAHDPAETAGTAPQPMLIVHAGRDYQVTGDDLAVWQHATAGRSDVVVKTYPSLNHVLAEGNGASTPEEYQRPANVARAVIDDIAAWVTR